MARNNVGSSLVVLQTLGMLFATLAASTEGHTVELDYTEFAIKYHDGTPVSDCYVTFQTPNWKVFVLSLAKVEHDQLVVTAHYHPEKHGGKPHLFYNDQELHRVELVRAENAKDTGMGVKKVRPTIIRLFITHKSEDKWSKLPIIRPAPRLLEGHVCNAGWWIFDLYIRKVLEGAAMSFNEYDNHPEYGATEEWYKLEGITPAFKAMILSMLNETPEDRPTPAQLLEVDALKIYRHIPIPFIKGKVPSPYYRNGQHGFVYKGTHREHYPYLIKEVKDNDGAMVLFARETYS